MPDYRSATIADAVGIADVMSAVWPEDKADVIRIAGAIARPNHETIVAVDGKKVLGFIDGFTTLSEDNEDRLEIDLLAVLPTAQKQGIGSELIRRLTDAKIERDFARALIRVGNTGSERAFAACGYKPASDTSVLFVSDTDDRDVERIDDLHIVPVETFSYAGLWLEGRRTRDNLAEARNLTVSGLVGAVIPSDDVADLAPEQLGYERVGEYRWWRHG